MKIYNHFIPRLLLRQFACTDTKINIFRFATEEFVTCKLKKAFAEKDIYDEDLEAAFNVKLEGAFADLLNHRLLKGDTITIDREENFLIRKFLLINSLRNPMSNKTFEEKVSITRSEDHPIVQEYRRMNRVCPELVAMWDNIESSQDTYMTNLERAIKVRDIDELADIANDLAGNPKLAVSARMALMPMIAFWDCQDTDQEFVLPKLQGVSLMDNEDGENPQSIIIWPYKMKVIEKTIKDMKNNLYPEYMSLWMQELQRMLYGIIGFCDNFSVYPISPTRAIVYISPYFRGFYPIMDKTGRIPFLPPVFDRKQFDRHFYKPMRMELFKPCNSFNNQRYTYHVKHLTLEEVCDINSIMLGMETQEFAFRDYDKIRNSLRYYDETAKFALPKKHDFRRWG